MNLYECMNCHEIMRECGFLDEKYTVRNVGNAVDQTLAALSKGSE